MHDYVLYCYLMPAGSPTMYALGISVPEFIGQILMVSYNDAASLTQSLGRIGLSPQQQNQIVNALTPALPMFVMSGVSITNQVAESFGIELHDGETPDEHNQIQLSKCSGGTGELTVSMILNNQIMPAPVQGCFRWNQVKTCLANSGQFTQQQLDSAKLSLEQTGTASLQSTGTSTAILACIGQAAIV
jgi:hypothetical protein